MDPTLSILTLALNLAQQYIHEARNTADKSAVRCEKLLYAAKEAIQGLYNEPVDIIISAMYCDLSKQEEIDTLMKRIDQYLKLERLRPLLKEAIEGLDVYREELSRDRYYFASLLFARSNEETINNFENLLKDLRGYYDQLDAEAFKSRDAGTGLLLIPLMNIRNSLATKDRQKVINYASAPEIAYQQRRLSELIGKISRTTNELILAFAQK